MVQQTSDASRALPCVGTIALLVLGLGCSAVSAHPASDQRAAVTNAADPPLHRLNSEPPELPNPLGEFELLNATERVLIAAFLEQTLHSPSSDKRSVWIRPDRFLVIVAPEDENRIKRQLTPLFRSPENLSVQSDARPITFLNAIGHDSVKPELVHNGYLDYEAIWGALVNAFPEACDAEVDSSTIDTDPAERRFSFRTHDRRVPSSSTFRGIVIKERVRLELRAAGTTVHRAALALEQEVFWRRRSQSTWNRVATAEDLGPAMLSQGAQLGLSDCKTGLLDTIIRCTNHDCE
jgi:hypothetical protein